MKKIEIKNLNIAYGIFKKYYIIKDLTVTFKEGDIVILYGKNGVGKTTLLRSICGQLPVTSGQIIWNGADLTNKDKLRRLKSSGNFEAGKMLYKHASLKENILFNTCLLRSNGLAPQDFPENLLSYKELYNKNIGKMSLGQRQKAALICALRKPADLFFFDEPDNGLDRNSLEEFCTVIKEIHSKAIVVIATHDSVLTHLLGTDIIFMKDDSYVIKKRNELPSHVEDIDKVLHRWIKDGSLDE